MGVQVRVQNNISAAAIQFAARVRADLAESGRPILEAAAAGAPYEPVPRHGVHLRETGYVRLAADVAGADRVAVGFTAFWAGWQHEHMDWHHEFGHAKFLELAVVEGAQAWREGVAELVRNALTG